MSALLSWRTVGAIVGAALLGAVAYVNIEATGGFGTPHSYVVLAVAAGVGCGFVFAGMAWAAGRKPLAVLFVVCIVAGDAFGLLQTANRLVAASEAQQSAAELLRLRCRDGPALSKGQRACTRR